MIALALALSLLACPPADRKPLLVLVEEDPWLMVIGSDSPTFALFDDGLVIYRRETPGDTPFASVRLDSKEQGALVARLLADRLAFEGLKDRYELTATSDQTTCSIHSWLGGKPRSVSVYGALRSDEEVRAKAPAAFLAAFDAMRSYTNAAAVPWLPAKIEVMAYPFENSADTPVEWPKDWPAIDDPTTRRRGKSLSLYVDGTVENLRRLREFHHARRETQAVLMGGKKWSTYYRFPFPGEEAWMH
jgi:hypothetical protein